MLVTFFLHFQIVILHRKILLAKEMTVSMLNLKVFGKYLGSFFSDAKNIGINPNRLVSETVSKHLELHQNRFNATIPKQTTDSNKNLQESYKPYTHKSQKIFDHFKNFTKYPLTNDSYYSKRFNTNATEFGYIGNEIKNRKEKINIISKEAKDSKALRNHFANKTEFVGELSKSVGVTTFDRIKSETRATNITGTGNSVSDARYNTSTSTVIDSKQKNVTIDALCETNFNNSEKIIIIVHDSNVKKLTVYSKLIHRRVLNLDDQKTSNKTFQVGQIFKVYSNNTVFCKVSDPNNPEYYIDKYFVANDFDDLLKKVVTNCNISVVGNNDTISIMDLLKIKDMYKSGCPQPNKHATSTPTYVTPSPNLQLNSNELEDPLKPSASNLKIGMTQYFSPRGSMHSDNPNDFVMSPGLHHYSQIFFDTDKKINITAHYNQYTTSSPHLKTTKSFSGTSRALHHDILPNITYMSEDFKFTENNYNGDALLGNMSTQQSRFELKEDSDVEENNTFTELDSMDYTGSEPEFGEKNTQNLLIEPIGRFRLSDEVDEFENHISDTPTNSVTLKSKRIQTHFDVVDFQNLVTDTYSSLPEMLEKETAVNATFTNDIVNNDLTRFNTNEESKFSNIPNHQSNIDFESAPTTLVHNDIMWTSVEIVPESADLLWPNISEQESFKDKFSLKQNSTQDISTQNIQAINVKNLTNILSNPYLMENNITEKYSFEISTESTESADRQILILSQFNNPSEQGKLSNAPEKINTAHTKNPITSKMIKFSTNHNVAHKDFTNRFKTQNMTPKKIPTFSETSKLNESYITAIPISYVTSIKRETTSPVYKYKNLQNVTEQNFAKNHQFSVHFNDSDNLLLTQISAKQNLSATNTKSDLSYTSKGSYKFFQFGNQASLTDPQYQATKTYKGVKTNKFTKPEENQNYLTDFYNAIDIEKSKSAPETTTKNLKTEGELVFKQFLSKGNAIRVYDSLLIYCLIFVIITLH